MKPGISVWSAFYGEHHILNRKRQIIVQEEVMSAINFSTEGIYIIERDFKST